MHINFSMNILLTYFSCIVSKFKNFAYLCISILSYPYPYYYVYTYGITKILSNLDIVDGNSN